MILTQARRASEDAGERTKAASGLFTQCQKSRREVCILMGEEKASNDFAGGSDITPRNSAQFADAVEGPGGSGCMGGVC